MTLILQNSIIKRMNKVCTNNFGFLSDYENSSCRFYIRSGLGKLYFQVSLLNSILYKSV